MAVVYCQNIDFEVALRKLRRKCEREGIYREMKQRQFHLTNNERKRMKRITAQRRLRKLMQHGGNHNGA